MRVRTGQSGSAREEVIHWTRTVGILPAIKLKQSADLLPYVGALYQAGVRVVEITATTPGVLDALKTASAEFGAIFTWESERYWTLKRRAR